MTGRLFFLKIAVLAGILTAGCQTESVFSESYRPEDSFFSKKRDNRDSSYLFVSLREPRLDKITLKGFQSAGSGPNCFVCQKFEDVNLDGLISFGEEVFQAGQEFQIGKEFFFVQPVPAKTDKLLIRLYKLEGGEASLLLATTKIRFGRGFNAVAVRYYI